MEPGLHEKAVLGSARARDPGDFTFSAVPPDPIRQVGLADILHRSSPHPPQQGWTAHWWDFGHLWIQPLQECLYL